MMVNYKTATNFELNKRLAELRGWNICEKQYSESTVRTIGDFNNTRDWSYCSSWADMGPVIEELRLSVAWNWEVKDMYSAFGTRWEKRSLGDYPLNFMHSDPFPLRAAVIVAIQVLEQRAEEM